MFGQRPFANLDTIDKYPPSFVYIALKYSLIAILIVNLINLGVAFTTGLTAIEEGLDATADDADPDKSSTRKTQFIIHLAINVLIMMSGLVGVTLEKFRLLLIVTILMAIQSVTSFFFVVFTTPILIAIVINILLTNMIGAFALLTRSRQIAFSLPA